MLIKIRKLSSNWYLFIAGSCILVALVDFIADGSLILLIGNILWAIGAIGAVLEFAKRS